MFTTTHLRFVCEATTPLKLDAAAYRAGTNLRGAMGNVMQRAYCAALTPDPSPTRRGEIDPNHVATCPVCWLLAANEKPGQERRGYTLTPPLDEPETGYAKGDRFEFGLTLFGETIRLLPYFILTVPEMGRMGVGAGRGKFDLKQVWAVDPFNAQRECLLAEGENMVHTPTLTLSSVEGHAEKISQTMNGTLSIQFLTPMRLIVNEQLLKAPDFAVFFARLLKRLDELNDQFGDKRRRPLEEVESLHALANQVRLIESGTRWIDMFSGSSRTGNRTPIGGFIGKAKYSAPHDVWRTLLPYLLWGQSAQVGKDTVKGNGVFKISDC